MKLLDDSLGEGQEFDIRMFIVQVLCKLGDTLGIRLSLKLEALPFEEDLEFFIIRDNSIVNDRELPT